MWPSLILSLLSLLLTFMQNIRILYHVVFYLCDIRNTFLNYQVVLKHYWIYLLNL